MIENNLLFIALSTIAVSYGWGMRGTLCGGEQGALLPGAFLGFLFAAFSPSPVIAANVLTFTAIGACAMFFGGDMTYGETLGFCLHRDGKPPENFRKGMLGVFTKGSLWFALTAGFLGIGVGTMSGTYTWKDLLILFIAVPFVRLVAYWFFNKPNDKEKNYHPTIYFSKTRQESWGKQLAFVICIFVLMLSKEDTYSMKLMLFGALGGAAGWMCGLSCFNVVSRPLKSGKYLLGKLQKNGYIDGWKIMECMLGGFGGLFISVGAILTNNHVKGLVSKTPNAQDLYPQLFKILPWIMVGLFVVDLSQHLFKKRPNKLQIENNFKQKFTSEKEYNLYKSRLDNPKYPLRSEKFESFYEVCEKPVYGYIPLLLVLLGSTQSARIISGFMLLIIATERICSDRFTNTKSKPAMSVLFGLICIAVLALGEFILPNGFSNLAIWILLCLEYEFYQLICDFRITKLKQLHKDKQSLFSLIFSRQNAITMHIYYFITLTFMLWCGITLF